MTKSSGAVRLGNIRQKLLSGNLMAEDISSGILAKDIYDSWQRSMQSGVDPYKKSLPDNILEGSILAQRLEQRRESISICKPTIQHLHALLAGVGGVIILSDHQGVIIDSMGDPEFMSKSDRVLLKTGASWLERHRGTNAIGLAISKRGAATVLGENHFLEAHSFLSCSAAPIFLPDRRLVAVLDISTDKNSHHPHTIGLVKTAVICIEKQLFFADAERFPMTIKIHSEFQGLGSITEGIIGIGFDGLIQAAVTLALPFLEIQALDVGAVKLQQILDISLDKIFSKKSPEVIKVRTHRGKTLYIRCSPSSGRVFKTQESKFLVEDEYVHEADNVLLSLQSELRNISLIAIENMLINTGGNISKAATQLGVSRNTVYKYLKQITAKKIAIE